MYSAPHREWFATRVSDVYELTSNAKAAGWVRVRSREELSSAAGTGSCGTVTCTTLVGTRAAGVELGYEA